MEYYSALSLIKQMPENKAQINSFVRSIKDEITRGYGNPLELDLRLKILEEIIKAIRKDEEIQDIVLTEAEKYPEKTITIFGCEVQKRNATTYDYSGCNDSELELLKQQVERANKALKDRQEFLKHVQPNTVNGETGEVLNPPVALQKVTLAVKIL